MISSTKPRRANDDSGGFVRGNCVAGRTNRRGQALWLVVVVLLCLSLGGLWLLMPKNSGSPSGDGGAAQQTPIVVYCAASNKNVMEAVRQDYEQEFGTPVMVQYGPSQTLMASMEISRTGDLYLPADDSFLKIARDRNLIAEQLPLAEMQVVVAVPKGNPLQIQTLADLVKENVRIAQGNAEATAIGKVTQVVLTALGQWEGLKQRTTVFKTTVNEVANDVKIGAVDAGIVYDAVLYGYDSLEGVSIPELSSIRSKIAVGVLSTSSQPQAAMRFARYLSARDKGLTRYREFGFQPVSGDPWSEQPELTLYAGSMLRPAIEETITEFEQREGVRVTRVYNGCGILVAQMKAGDLPDAYFACDAEFMKQVSDLFPDAKSISQNELVILVKKGNPLKINSLHDLSRPGIRVGIGHEKQCAMGWITQKTFAESGLQSQLMQNVVVQTPTGDMLVNQMRSGSLDAAVAYLSNAAGSGEELDAIRIQGLPCSVATQPYGVAQNSDRKQLGLRLLTAIRAAPSQEKFSSQGFRWLNEARDSDE